MNSIRKPIALLVAPDPEERSRYGDWLERRGVDVLECPGPTGEGRCVGLRSGRCSLSEAADVVVLDHRAGLSRELEIHYLSSGTPVVAVGTDDARAMPALHREWVLRLPWPLTESSFVTAVRYQARYAGERRDR